MVTDAEYAQMFLTFVSLPVSAFLIGFKLGRMSRRD